MTEQARESADIRRLMELLPHRPPMLLIDRMTRRASAIR
jgi:3-hydroxymyristoyl/3-hydroxydecanoyl-(acyl carrier protein) dehydratase